MAVLVNTDKVQRAQSIIALLGRQPKTPDEVDTKNKFTAILNSEGVQLTDETVLQFIYEKLGGLVRTEEEQREFEVKVAPLKKKKTSEKD